MLLTQSYFYQEVDVNRALNVIIIMGILILGCGQNSSESPAKKGKDQNNNSNIIQTRASQLLHENQQLEFKDMQAPLSSDHILAHCHRLRTDAVMLSSAISPENEFQLDTLENLREMTGRAYVSSEAITKIRLKNEQRENFATALEALDEVINPIKKWRLDYIASRPEDPRSHRVDIAIQNIDLQNILGRVKPASDVAVSLYNFKCAPYENYVDQLSAFSEPEKNLKFLPQDLRYLSDLNARSTKALTSFGQGSSRQDFGLIVAPSLEAPNAMGVYVIEYDYDARGIHKLDFVQLEEKNRTYASSTFDVHKFHLGSGYVTLFLSRQAAVKNMWVVRDRSDKKISNWHQIQLIKP